MSTLTKILSNKKVIVLVFLFVVIGIAMVIINVATDIIEEKNEEEKLLKSSGITDVFASTSTSVIRGRKYGVEEFLKLAEDKSIVFNSEDLENCFNITPDIVFHNSDYQIFKFSDTADSYLVYKNEIYKIGINKRERGITSFAIADINEDGIFEIFYSYRWKVSEDGRTNISYFDPLLKKEVGINKNYENAILIKKGDDLTVYSATLSNDESFTNFTMNSKIEEDILVIKEGSVKPMTRLEFEEFYLKGM